MNPKNQRPRVTAILRVKQRLENVYSKDFSATSKEHNAQSFADQHTKQSISWYWFANDEVKPDKIWETDESG